MMVLLQRWIFAAAPALRPQPAGYMQIFGARKPGVKASNAAV